MEHAACKPPDKGPVEPASKAAVADKAISYEQDCVAGLPWDPEQYRACTYFSNRKDNTAHIALVGNSTPSTTCRRCSNSPARTGGS